jgi:hypothetical protein
MFQELPMVLWKNPEILILPLYLAILLNTKHYCVLL